MESLFPKAQDNASSFFHRISDSTRSNPASNVAQLKTSGARIFVKGKEVYFNRKDDIFLMKRPTTKQVSSEKCNLCDKELKKSSKKKHCDFWGLCFCKECLYKSRLFPVAEKDGTTSRGECCMICDRKFNAKDIQVFYEEQIDKKEISIKKGEQVLKDRKDRLDTINTKIEELNKDDEKKQKEFENKMEDLQTKMEVIQNRIKEVTNENEILNKRIQTRNEDAQKKQDEKIAISDDVDNLKKEIVSLEKRLNKLMVTYEEICSTTGSGRGRQQSKQGLANRNSRRNNYNRNSDSIQSYEAGSYILKDEKKKPSKNPKGSYISRASKSSMVDDSRGACSNWVIF